MKINYLQLLILIISFVSCKNNDNNDTPEIPITPPVVENPNAVNISNASFEKGLEGWSRINYANGEKTILKVVDGEGINKSKALKIQQLPENGKCCVGVKRTLTKLEPDQMYRMTARVRYSDVPNGQGTGPVIFRPNTKQYWNSSQYLYGTELKNWINITVDFMSDDNGNADIVAALGFWQGGLSNGGFSTGTAFFDNISVVKVTDELFSLESEHIRIFIEPSKINISTLTLKKWLENLDKIYNAYVELIGEKPHEGRKLAIQTSKGVAAWAIAGYPIIWDVNSSAVEDVFSNIEKNDDWSFGIMHEIGHVFNIGNTSWNWTDEMFANIRMHYALEKTNGKVYASGREGLKIYTGGEILDYYRIQYENTISTKVSHDGIHYMLTRMAKQITWEPYKKTFQYLKKYGGNGGNNYQRFAYFVNTLNNFAKEADSSINLWDNFSDFELNSIKRQLN